MATTLSILLALAAFWAWTPDRDPADLATRYLRTGADRVDVLGTTLHVRDDGPKNAPALLFLHGFGASLHTWEPWAQALAGDFRVLRVDLPGHGLSPPDPSDDYTDARSLQLLLALLDGLGVQRVSVIGNSMGGRIAWTMAARHADRVDRLVLIAPDGFASPGYFEYGKPPEVSAWLQLMRVALPRPLLRMSLAPAYVDPAALTDERLDRYHDLLRAPGARAAMLQRMRQTVLTDPVPLLKTVQAPTLLLWGEQDQMIPATNAADYRAALPHSTLVTLPGLGHLPHEEDPVRALVPVRAFLQR
jgi:pimeloyl-ACP methyl ester carboxylesterase